MLPTTQRKMQDFIQRNDAPPGGSAPPVGLTSPRPQAAQLAASPMIARREIPDSVKLPLPRSGRYASATQPDPTIPPLNAPAHYQPMRRSRTSSDQGRNTPQVDRAVQILGDLATRQDGSPRRDRVNAWGGSSVGSPRPQRGELAARWEEQSTVGTLFSDSEATRSVAGRNPMYERRRGDGMVLRQSQADRRNRQTDEAHLFVLGENGQLQFVDAPRGEAGKTNASNKMGAGAGAPTREDPFVGTSREEPVLKKSRTLSRTKFALRNGEEAKRRSFAEQAAMSPQKIMSTSPEPYDSAGDAADATKREQNGHELNHKRSTMFQDLDDHITDDISSRSVSSQEDEVEAQPTPKAPSRELKAPRQPAGPPKAQVSQKTQKAITSQQTQKAVSTRKNPAQDSSMPRHGNGHELRQKKRRLSLDYDDAALSNMEYAELRGEAFDHDPARAAIQTAREPSGDSLEEKLKHYQHKDENSQHNFFAQVSVREWEQSGDWFLEQFGNIVSKMKQARQAKRQMADKYEEEIAARAEAVRIRTEGVERTLKDLKKDGEVMMKGKEVEDD
ncbi:hypothetical protein NKR23_g11159 [Pleurostoma richardsiae]|uniref:Extracellular mutant protein 11 C-terminal domain-containing protein n=1 Tax=Pleurostoma richardsiae TaxID=41990 RepID=A0AA38RAY0_9PEZI|nr:hypothetical protein NKR23_g11159 [Pleurostoma richardsiae]